MKTDTYWAILNAMSDSGEPGVVLFMAGGVMLEGIARNSGYGETLPKGAAWFSDVDNDMVIDIRSVIGIRRSK